MKNVNRNSIVVEVSKKTGLSQDQARAAVNATIAVISEELMALNKVTLHDFGVFKFRRRAAFLARNPRTGDEVPIPAHRKIEFRPAPTLRLAVIRARVSS